MGTMILTEQVNAGGESIRKQQTLSETDEGQKSVTASVPATTTDMLVNWTCDVSELKGIYIVAEGGALTFETNDGGAPSNTIVLVADVPYIWHTNSYDACKLTIDVTKLYLTNAGAGAVVLKLKSLEDSTP